MGWVINELYRKYSFITCNNQELFNVLTIFKHLVTSKHLQCSRDVLVRNVCYRRQEWQPTRCDHGRMAGITILKLRDNFWWNQTVWWVVALPHLHGLELLCDEVRVVNMDARNGKLVHSLLLRWCSWLLLIFYMAVDMLFGDILVYPCDTKIWPMSCHVLMMPPWHDISLICFWLEREECSRLWMGGPLIVAFVLFDLAHGVRCLISNEYIITKVWIEWIFYF
jgi:hypothetical protein